MKDNRTAVYKDIVTYENELNDLIKQNKIRLTTLYLDLLMNVEWSTFIHKILLLFVEPDIERHLKIQRLSSLRHVSGRRKSGLEMECCSSNDAKLQKCDSKIFAANRFDRRRMLKMTQFCNEQ